MASSRGILSWLVMLVFLQWYLGILSYNVWSVSRCGYLVLFMLDGYSVWGMLLSILWIPGKCSGCGVPSRDWMILGLSQVWQMWGPWWRTVLWVARESQRNGHGIENWKKQWKRTRSKPRGWIPVFHQTGTRFPGGLGRGAQTGR